MNRKSGSNPCHSYSESVYNVATLLPYGELGNAQAFDAQEFANALTGVTDRQD